MDEIDWSHLLEDEDMLLKAIALSYMGIGLYYGMKTKPMMRKEAFPQEQPKKTAARSLSDMIKKMIEEAYGIEGGM